MGLRCSLLGHAYGDPEMERERDDRGDEVVVTVREVRTCSRCGDETVVTENTEVRPVEPAPDAGDSGGTDVDADAGSGAEGTAGADADADADAAGASVDDEFDPPGSAAEDDGVILDDEGDGDAPAPEREPGEWPDAADTRLDEQEAAADAESPTGDAEPDPDDGATADEGGAPARPDAEADAEPVESGGDIIDADAAAESDPDHDADADAGDSGWPDPGPDAVDEGFDATPEAADGEVEMGGLTPRGVANADDEGESEGDVVGSDRADPDGPFTTGIESAGSADLDGSTDVDVEAVFRCPNCDYEEPVLDSSLREGDICPECRRGYLAEQSPTRN